MPVKALVAKADPIAPPISITPSDRLTDSNESANTSQFDLWST